MTASHNLFFPYLSYLLSTVLIACACSTPPAPTATPVASAPPPQKEEPKWIPGPDPQEIKQAVNARGAELRQCYLLGTFRNSQLTGTVNVLFTIDTAGKVSRAADAGSDIEDPEVVTCVLGVFGNLQFARGGSSDTEVEYPVVFGARG
jgi:hypothetical protein